MMRSGRISKSYYHQQERSYLCQWSEDWAGLQTLSPTREWMVEATSHLIHFTTTKTTITITKTFPSLLICPHLILPLQPPGHI